MELLPSKQNVNNRARTTLFKDQIRMCVSNLAASGAVLNLVESQGKG